MTDAAIEIVKASENYVEGSLERNGDSFTWWTDEGIRCIYNPRMREKYDNMVAPEDPIADGVYNEPVATKGGWPSGNQVYLIGPYYGIDSSFTNQYKTEAANLAEAIGDTDGYTLYSGSAATVDKVAEAISNGAIVIFDSHGTTDYESGEDYVTGANYSYLCLTSKSGLTTDDYNAGASYFTDSEGVMCACVNGAAIANHMTKNSPAGILWMAICLGMATNTMCEPMRNKGVEVVYGYSQSVSFAGDYLFEEVFWDNMCAGKDVATSIAAMKSNWGNWDWSTNIASYYGYTDGYSTISAARADYAAFPIVVSDEDAHPGQKTGSSNYGADSLQTVKSTYTLFRQYAVTAQSNNNAYGTVSANGSTITAVPAEGYFAESATVISGTAAVTQSGNTFSVLAQSDCTVQINFAPKTVVTVNFFGTNVPAQTGYAGDAMSLPTAEAPEGYTFLGWMDTPLSDKTTEKPIFYTDSFVPTGNTTLYALYKYVDTTTGEGGSGDYVKVTETPEDWSGEYVIVYETGGYILDSSLATIDASGNYKTVTITDFTIAEADAEPYKFTVAAMTGGYSILGTNGSYIGGTSGSNTLNAGSSALLNTIALDASGNATIISNTSHLRFNTSGSRFRYYKSASYSSQQPIALYRKDDSSGTVYYVSTLCDHASTSEVAAVAATCTEIGYTAGVFCNDCKTYISGHEAIAALGHDWSEWEVTTAPGCETAGEQTHTCSRCDAAEAQSIAALGHTLGEGTVTTPATCTTDGVMSYSCTVCGSTTTEVIPATGHNYVADGNSYTCTDCGDNYVIEDGIVTSPIAGFAYKLGVDKKDGNILYFNGQTESPTVTYRLATTTNADEAVDVYLEEADGGYYLYFMDGSTKTYIVVSHYQDGNPGYGKGTLALTTAVPANVYAFDTVANTLIYDYDGNNAYYMGCYGTHTNISVSNTSYITGDNAANLDVSQFPARLYVVSESPDPEPTEPTEPTEPETTEPEPTEPETSIPSTPGQITTLQYVFSNYPAGTQYAQGENHILDNVVTLTINGAHLNGSIRLYAGSNAVFSSTKVIDVVTVKAGNKAGTLNIYGSDDGETWNLIKAQATNANYTDYTVEMPEGKQYTYLKLESVGAQIRVSEMSIDVVEPASEETELVDQWNVVLQDDLNVNFHLNLNAEDQVKVTVGTEETVYDASALEQTADGKYIVTVEMAAAQMMDTITIQIVGSNAAPETYTIRQYADKVLADDTKSAYHALVKEMLNYGAMAQVYFDYNASNLANAGIEGFGTAEVTEATYEPTVYEGAVEGIRFYSTTLSYRDKIALRFYFETTDDAIGSYTFTANGASCTPVKKGEYYYIEVAGITPDNLDQQIEVTVTGTNSQSLTIRYSPMNYIVRMNAKGGENLQALLKALYNYHLAAKALKNA